MDIALHSGKFGIEPSGFFEMLPDLRPRQTDPAGRKQAFEGLTWLKPEFDRHADELVHTATAIYVKRAREYDLKAADASLRALAGKTTSRGNCHS
jgi:hypothetical protein